MSVRDCVIQTLIGGEALSVRKVTDAVNTKGFDTKISSVRFILEQFTEYRIVNKLEKRVGTKMFLYYKLNDHYEQGLIDLKNKKLPGLMNETTGIRQTSEIAKQQIYLNKLLNSVRSRAAL